MLRLNLSKFMVIMAFSLLVVMNVAQAKSPLEVDIKRKIPYGAHELQHVDIYQPERCRAPASCPVVLWVHGGGWRNGDTSGRKSTSMQTLWAQQGIVMVGVNYRLSPDVVHPAHVEDVAAAINWSYKNIARYGGDPARMSLLGHSAGAHLVALVATNPRFLGAHHLDPAQVLKNVFPIDTASFDLTDSSRMVDRMVENAFGTDPTVLKDASPLQHVQKGRNYPSFIIAAAENRPDAIATSQRLNAALTQSGTSSSLITINYPEVGQLKAHAQIATDLADLSKPLTQKLIGTVLGG